MRIEDIDKNFKLQGLPEGVELSYFDVKEAPMKVWGLMYEEDSFCRLPDAVAKATSAGVYSLHEHCAGGRVTFATNSRYVAIACHVRSIGKMPHFTTIGSAGFDLYEENDFLCSFFPPYNYTEGYSASYSFGGEMKERRLLINFPLYTAVESLFIGIEKGATVTAGQLIGTVGDSAMTEVAQEPHLHFEMTVGGLQVDPAGYFSDDVWAELEGDTAYEG